MILDQEFYMSELDEKRKCFIYLPDNYENTKKRYPVLYMFDGHNIFYDEYATYGKALHLHEHIEKLGLNMIVVGQECSHHGNDRLKEYAPYPFYDLQFGAFEGLGNKTMNFFVQELKPYIDKNFRTKSSRENTFIGGSSCGGLMSLYASYKYSHVYSKAIVISPYILSSIDAIMNDIRNSQIHKNTSIYLSWGAKEESLMHNFVQETKACTEIANLLSDKNVKILFNVRQDGRHCEEDWEKECDTFLSFLNI